MKRPSIEALREPLRSAARTVARSIEQAGSRAWVVGGTVRDLALGQPVGDLDMASSLRPEEAEALFARALSVGKAFGTLIVVLDGIHVELTTFRAEGSYGDKRRPDEVHYASDPSVDARRRDFTCNALYLDPLNDEFLDPFDGLGDLQRNLLRCVGQAEERFREDGLRILRLARFAAGYGLDVANETQEGARQALDSLAGVSPERLLQELVATAKRPGGGTALELLLECGAMERAFPRLWELGGQQGARERARLLARLEAAAGRNLRPELFFAAWFDPLAESAADLDRAAGALEELRPSRVLRDEVGLLWSLRSRLRSALRDPRPEEVAWRAERMRIVRRREWSDVASLERARPGVGYAADGLAAWEEFRARTTEEERFPQPWLTSADLAQSGLPRGPVWGKLLRAAEDQRLAGAHPTRREALAWLSDEVERQS